MMIMRLFGIVIMILQVREGEWMLMTFLTNNETIDHPF